MPLRLDAVRPRLRPPRHDFAGRPFPAADDAGAEFLLVPLYRMKPTARGWERDPSPEYLSGLRTEGGQPVEREDHGRYLVIDPDGPIRLRSDHPDAV